MLLLNEDTKREEKKDSYLMTAWTDTPTVVVFVISFASENSKPSWQTICWHKQKHTHLPVERRFFGGRNKTGFTRAVAKA